jgi:lipid-A-disaccharide synthase
LKEGAGISRLYADSVESRLTLIVAGEASADLHGSNLVRAMKTLDPYMAFWGIGGRMMEKAGVKIRVPSSEMAVVGLTEVFSRWRTILKAYFQLKSILKHMGPNLLILIDYPEFNIPLARQAKRFNVPVLYYISPQVWAWRAGRTKKLACRVDRMAVILPFEEGFFRRKGLTVDYVGHPLLDAIPAGLNKREAMMRFDLEGRTPIIGLLPGSRKEEVIRLLPPMVKAAELLKTRYPSLTCVLPCASTIPPELIESILSQSTLSIKVIEGDIYRVLSACDFALVKSGTATLETAIMGVPMVIVYHISPISYWAARMAVKVPFVGLVNLVAGEKVVPELIQNDMTPENLVRETVGILESRDRRENMVKKLREVRERLRQGASEKTAQIALEMMTRG